MQHLDWQTLVTMAIGVAAAIHLARRWWPGLKGLVKPQLPVNAVSQGGCGASGSPTAAASCSSGCGNCGQSSTSPTKDHRRVIHIHQD